MFTISVFAALIDIIFLCSDRSLCSPLIGISFDQFNWRQPWTAGAFNVIVNGGIECVENVTIIGENLG